jgi:hypothetical protein
LAEEWTRLTTFGEHHRRLASRLALIVIATGIVDVLGSVAMYGFEHSAHGRTSRRSAKRCSSRRRSCSRFHPRCEIR